MPTKPNTQTAPASQNRETINGERIACYDNGGTSFDRYTVAYLDQPENNGCVAMVGMSDSPFHPQGFGQHCAGMTGKHLGKRIPFASLPADCQQLVRQDLEPIGLAASLAQISANLS